MKQNPIISTACIAPGAMVPIGVHGTFNVRSQAFDLSAWVEAYGEGTATVHVQRPGETLESGSPLIYEPNDVTTKGNTLIWTFDAVDSGIAGYGACSVIYTVNGEKKAETPPIRTYIAQSLEGGAGVSPTPITNNYDDLSNKPQINGHTLAGNQTGAQLGLVDATRGDELQTAIEDNADNLATHVADNSNPHDVTKAQVGLGNVDNTSDADKPVSTAQQAALDALGARVTTNAANLADHIEDTSNPHDVTKAQVGLGNVDNTSDADKPVSTAQQAALDALGARVTTNAQGIAANSSAISANTSAIATNTGNIQANTDAISSISAKIPTQASTSNQLADKEFVSDAINSSTAYFRGSFASYAALLAVAWQTADPTAANYVTNNDYAYVEDDETHADEAWRYIYVLESGGSDNGWQPQFRVNESPMTAQQIAAINSGITAAGVQQISTTAQGLAAHVADKQNPHEVTKAQVGLGNVDNTSDADKPVSTAQHAALDALGARVTANAAAISENAQNLATHAANGDIHTTAAEKDAWDAKADAADIPAAGNTAPAMDGTASAGVSAAYSRGDHVHPTDTSRAAASALAAHIADKANPHEVTAAQVGLGNVDNTSDADKPISTAQAAVNAGNQAQLDAFLTPKTIGPTALASFSDGVDGAILGKCMVNIEPAQSGSGDPSPTNVRPISGWTGATIKRYGTDESDSLSTYSISFGEAGTVYGGTLDVGTGVLTVTRGYLQLTNAADLYTFNNMHGVRILDEMPQSGNRQVGICSHEADVGDFYDRHCIWAGVNSRYIYWVGILDVLGISTVEEFNEWIATQTVQLAYELPTPITYQLTPVQVRTLLGLNNIYADCGGVTVQYRGDVPNLYENVAVITEQKNKFYCPPLYQYDGEDLTIKFADEIAQYSDVCAWLKARLAAKDISGIFVKDYFRFTTSNGYTFKARIADINHDLGYDDMEVTGWHIDFICDELWPDNHVWNKVFYNNGLATEPSPWLCSDLYHFLNSLSGNVPNGTGADPATVAVDYTSTGVLDKFPAWLRDAIVERRSLEPTRYSAGDLLTYDNSWAWKNIGKLWVPSETEVYGQIVWGTRNGYSVGETHQFPIFRDGKMRIKRKSGSRDNWWLRSAYSGDSTSVSYPTNSGNATYYYASYTDIAVPVCFRIMAN